MQDNQDKERSTVEVQSTREEKESRLGRGCLSLLGVVYCQIVGSATARSLVQRSPSNFGMSLCVIQKPEE
jgi:hypothetical protein